MTRWLANTIACIGILVWAAYIITELAIGGEVPEVLWGFPGVLVYALKGRSSGASGKADDG